MISSAYLLSYKKFSSNEPYIKLQRKVKALNDNKEYNVFITIRNEPVEIQTDNEVIYCYYITEIKLESELYEFVDNYVSKRLKLLPFVPVVFNFKEDDKESSINAVIVKEFNNGFIIKKV